MTASAGIYAERVSFPAEAPLATIALVPDGLDPATAASLPTAGGAALDIAERLTPLAGKTVVIVGAAGGIGSFLKQLAAKAGAKAIAVAHSDRDRATAERPKSSTRLRGSYPAGVDVLIDLASDDAQFSALAERCPAGTSYISRRVWRARRG